MGSTQEIGDVMYTVAETEDVKRDQKVTLFRNGPIYTLSLSDTSNKKDYKHVRADMDQASATRLYLKLVRAILTGKYDWKVRAGWVKAAGEN